MCGIAGFTRFNSPTGNEQTLVKMGDAIAHRGPDAHGEFLDERVGLCHRRLSIIDLSEAGNQPMYSDDGNLVMVFNGEIYNFAELRTELKRRGYKFRSKTDSEVILALYQFDGAACLQKLNGMFAFAIWDRKKKELFLARDRLGKKPLYYFNDQKRFIFGSEIKAIFEVESVPRELRDDAICDYFFYQYVPDPKSIFKNIYKLKPGHWLRVREQGIEEKEYWDVSFQSRAPGSEDEIAHDLLELIADSVKIRLNSDVPLGAFLSGGVDSSAVVALMARESERPPLTCSIGFGDKNFDEVKFAAKVADLYKTKHHELMVKSNVTDSIRQIVKFFDEPFADQSLVPTFFVSQIAREKVTVALAGDGGDESFAGYNKYRVDAVEHRSRRLVPGFVRRKLTPKFTGQLGESNYRHLSRLGTLLGAIGKSPADAFFQSNAFMTDTAWNRLANEKTRRRLQGYHPSDLTRQHFNHADTDDHLSKVLYTDIKSFLPGDILVKVDRMSMANSLEVRAPLLDYRVVEYAAGLPSNLKLRKGQSKYILKKAFGRFLPYDILHRKKMGFSVPLAGWLKSELNDVCESALFDKSSGISNYFNMSEVANLWHQHQHGREDNSTILWSLLMFELWWQHYIV